MKQQAKEFSANDIGAVMTKVVKHVEGQAASIDTAVFGDEHSRHRMPLPEEYGSQRDLSDLPMMFPQIVRIFQGVLGSYVRYKFYPEVKESEASPTFLTQLEAYAREIGATAIGYAKITPDHIFKGFVVPYQNAVVVISEMRKELFNTAPSTESMVEVAKAYADTTQIANKLSSHLRRHGFGAFSGVSIGGSVDQTRLAERAGLGKIGYHGSLISPSENEHDWVLDFCRKCKKCIRSCPAQAIRQGPEPDADGRISMVNANKCGPYMSANHGCGICIAVCPFSLAGYEKIQNGFLKAQARHLE